MNKINPLQVQDPLQRCLDAAVRYLSYRPRGEAELKARMTQRGFAADVQDSVIIKLRERGLVDDSAFAQFWKDNRDTFRPRSKWLTKLELRRKGVATEIIDRVVDTIDDKANAYRAALSKSRSFLEGSGADYPTFHRRLAGYLQRLGFTSSVIKGTLERIWQEQKKNRTNY